MKNETEPNRLMDDILEEIAPPAFRADLLDRIVKRAQRRSRARRRNQRLFATALVMIIGLFVWKTHTSRNENQDSTSTALNVVNSRPLSPSMVVESFPGSVDVIHSFSGMAALAETGPSGHDFRELSDDELLALMPDTPSVLIRRSPHEAELLIVDASTQTAHRADETYGDKILRQ
jgi:hypothetical protein